MALQHHLSPVEHIFREVLPERIPNYEERQQQVEMALAVERALRRESHLLVEAGTGTGKSFAYLIPLALELISDQKADSRGIVSTATIALQEQLINQDLPFLERVLGWGLQPRLAKGKKNYLCLLRYQEEIQPTLFDDDKKKMIREWIESTETGDRAELPSDPGDLWEQLAADDACPGRKCRLYDRCFLMKARQQLIESRLIVCNHALFFTDLNLRTISEGNAALLPAYRLVVFDEAQHVEETARETMSLEFSNRRIPSILYQLRRREGCDLEAVQNAIRAGEQFFGEILRRNGDRGKFVFLPDKELVELGQELQKAVQTVALAFQPDMLGEREHALIQSLGRCHHDLDEILAADDPGRVFWGEQRVSRGRPLITLHATPLDLSGDLADLLFHNEAVTSVIMTSATLSTGGGFSYLKEAIGCDDAAEVALSSPFDYRRQCLLYLPDQLPDPRQPDFHRRVVPFIEDLLQCSQGRAFVLFTSYRGLDQVYNELAPRLPWRCLRQGDLAKHKLLAKFKDDLHSVLFATLSFWEGVDVQGEALSCVILVKLPFSVPDDPINQARYRLIEERGGNSFLNYCLPEAILKLKQGFGRLIRTGDDRGVVAILDRRVKSQWYGRRFLAALPPCQVATKLTQVAEFLSGEKGTAEGSRGETAEDDDRLPWD